MSNEIIDILLDTGIDALKLLPFLFITYLIMEYIEHKTGNKTKSIIKKSGKWGPILGALLGVVPQCGFSAAAANLYAGKVITLGTLIAIFLSTSDEMLPILISEQISVIKILKIILIKALIGIIAGFLIDFILRKRENKILEKSTVDNTKHEHEHSSEENISHLCEHEHCHCDEKNILISALKHSINIFIFIYITSFLLNTLFHFVGEETLGNFILNKPIIGELLAGLVGLVPNCAASVVITELYLKNVISLGAMMSGLLVGAGVGLLVLFKINDNIKENLKITALLYTIGAVAGTFIEFSGISMFFV